MKKLFFRFTAILFVILLIRPMGAFAVQSGGGYIVYDQINSLPGINSGGSFTNNTGGSPVSSQTMSGGGYISYGGAYRNSSITPPPPISGGSSSTPTPIPTSNPLIPQPNDNILVFNPIINQPQNININENVGIASIEQPALFDITAQTIQTNNKNNIFFIAGSSIFLLILLFIIMILVRRAHKKKMEEIFNEMKKEQLARNALSARNASHSDTDGRSDADGHSDAGGKIPNDNIPNNNSGQDIKNDFKP